METRTCNVCRADRSVERFSSAFGVCDACHPAAWAGLQEEIAIQRTADRMAGAEETEQDRFERELHEGYLADLAALSPIDPETRRRSVALCAYRCPDHGCDLEECEWVDEEGVYVYYRCPVSDHHFGSIHDAAGGYVPVDDGVSAARVGR